MTVWLRLRPWWPKVAGFVYPLVFLLPILALLGFVEAGKEATARFEGGDPAWAAEVSAMSARFETLSPRLLAAQNLFFNAHATALGLGLRDFVAPSPRRL